MKTPVAFTSAFTTVSYMVNQKLTPPLTSPNHALFVKQRRCCIVYEPHTALSSIGYWNKTQTALRFIRFRSEAKEMAHVYL